MPVMDMLYNSDAYAVVHFAGHDGFEIVDKRARRDVFIIGLLAAQFKTGVERLVEAGPTEEALDDFIAGYTELAGQPLTLH